MPLSSGEAAGGSNLASLPSAQARGGPPHLLPSAMPTDDRRGNHVTVSPVNPGPTSRAIRAIRAARLLAAVADTLQLVLFPVFIEGFASVLNDVLDVVVGLIMVRLVGWHLAFLPAFVVEALPVGDLAPTWTLAVFLATRSIPSRLDTPPQAPRILPPR